MTISIKTALNNIKSDKYNKKNIYLFFAVTTVLSVIYAMLIKTSAIFLLIITLIVYAIVIQGSLLSLLHNSLLKKEDIFPSLIKDFKMITFTAAKYIVGSIAYVIAFFIILLTVNLILKFAVPIPVIAKLIYSLTVFIITIGWIFLILGILFNYTMTLQIKEIFNLKKAFRFLCEAKEFLLGYFIKLLILLLLGIVVLVVLALICILVLTLVFIGVKTDMAVIQNVSYITGDIIGTLTALVFVIFAIDLTGQLYNTVFEKIKENQN